MDKTLRIEGMSCGHCVRAVQEALEKVDGVDVRNVEIGKADISYDPDQVDQRQIKEAIEEEGFDIVAS